jgi:hypothetical protein
LETAMTTAGRTATLPLTTAVRSSLDFHASCHHALSAAGEPGSIRRDFAEI